MKVQTAIKLDSDLLEMAKKEAQAQNRNLSSYIEHLLAIELGSIPKHKIRKAIFDTHYDLNLTKVSNLDTWLESLLNGEKDETI